MFPGACHNRFEHCIGTSYLCGEMLSSLRFMQKHLYDDLVVITDKDILCVKIAGLCHDLGHGPFSHLFDGELIPRSGRTSQDAWTHEQCSCDLFDDVIKKNAKVKNLFEKHGIGEEEQILIKSMIMGKSANNISNLETFYHGKSVKKQFLLEIVSNKATGIDCDKFDYFARDTHHVGIKNSFDFNRYFKNIRIMEVGNELRICARDKEESNLYEMFHIRWTLHRQVYQHKTTALIGELIVQGLLAVDKKFEISNSVDDLNRYVCMTDSIFYEVLRSTDSSEEVKTAQEFFRKIQNRELYHYCGEVNPKVVENVKSKELNPSQKVLTREEVASGIVDAGGEDVSQDDVCVLKAYFSFGKKGQNPLKKMHFFGKNGKLKEGSLNDLSSLLPRNFEETYFRVYCKNPEKDESVEKAFTNWCIQNGYSASSFSMDDEQ